MMVTVVIKKKGGGIHKRWRGKGHFMVNKCNGDDGAHLHLHSAHLSSV